MIMEAGIATRLTKEYFMDKKWLVQLSFFTLIIAGIIRLNFHNLKKPENENKKYYTCLFCSLYERL